MQPAAWCGACAATPPVCEQPHLSRSALRERPPTPHSFFSTSLHGGNALPFPLQSSHGHCIAIEKPHAHDILKSLPAHGASVHAQSAADFARDTFHPFQ